MKTKTAILFFPIIIFIMMCSCASNDTARSDSVKQSEIYQRYAVTYDAGEMELSAEASFRFGGWSGTTLELTGSSNVKFNGKAMEKDNNIFAGTFYESHQQTSSFQNCTFTYTDGDSAKGYTTYTNSITIDPIEISEYPATIKMKEGFTVSWKGNPIKDGEKVYLFLEGADLSSCSGSSSLVGATSIEVSPDLIKEMKPGSANLVLKREVSNDLKEATHLGGTITMTYVSKKVLTKIE